MKKILLLVTALFLTACEFTEEKKTPGDSGVITKPTDTKPVEKIDPDSVLSKDAIDISDLEYKQIVLEHPHDGERIIIRKRLFKGDNTSTFTGKARSIVHTANIGDLSVDNVYSDGSLDRKIYFGVDNKPLNGDTTIAFNLDSGIIYRGVMSKGLQTGEWKLVNSSGEPAQRDVFKNGESVSSSKYTDFASNKIVLEKKYTNNRPASVIKYYPSGQAKYKVNYINGFESELVAYHPNGEKAMVAFFKNKNDTIINYYDDEGNFEKNQVCRDYKCLFSEE